MKISFCQSLVFCILLFVLNFAQLVNQVEFVFEHQPNLNLHIALKAMQVSHCLLNRNKVLFWVFGWLVKVLAQPDYEAISCCFAGIASTNAWEHVARTLIGCLFERQVLPFARQTSQLGLRVISFFFLLHGNNFDDTSKSKALLLANVHFFFLASQLLVVNMYRQSCYKSARKRISRRRALCNYVLG